MQSIEYRLVFEEPSAEARRPIANHVGDILAICRESGVTRSAVKPFLAYLDDLHHRDEQRRAVPVSVRKQANQCTFCDAPDAMINEELYRVCELCGVIADTHLIQEEAWLQPVSHRHYNLAKDVSSTTLSLDAMLAAVRRLCSAHLLASVLADRAMYLATLYLLEVKSSSPRSAAPLIAASCVVYALLETWARLLVPVKVFKNQQWKTWWVLPTRALKR